MRTDAVAMLALAALLVVAGCRPAPQASELGLLGRSGPWPWNSRLVVYQERLWFVNSAGSVDHNSADVYSYDPGSGAVRYERHLFTQGVGWPAVSGGLLFFPFEDSRFHLGVGQVAVTNGSDWRLRLVPMPRIKHVTALADREGELLAAAAWRRPLLLASTDAGLGWRLVHLDASDPRRVARVARLVSVGGDLFGALTEGRGDPPEQRLVRLGPAALETVEGWPAGAWILALEAFRGRLYALLERESGVGLWSSDGGRLVPHEGLPEAPRDLAAEGTTALWLLAAPGPGGVVWRSEDAVRWTLQARVEAGTPRELEILAGRAYVAGSGANGRGALWGPAPAPLGEDPAREAPALADPKPQAVDWTLAGVALDAALLDPEGYADGARGLVDRLRPLARAGPPPGFLAQRLDGPFAAGSVPVPPPGLPDVPRETLGRWVLLWAMTVSGSGPVPLAWLREPFEPTPNPTEKYFEPLPAALAAIAWGRQDDAATVAALVDRLGRASDPLWLQGDVVGALAAVTGQRFGYRTGAWKDWWRRTTRGAPPGRAGQRRGPSRPRPGDPAAGGASRAAPD